MHILNIAEAIQNTKIQDFCEVTTCRCLLDPEDDSNMTHRNLGTYLPVNRLQHPTRHESSVTWPREI